MPFGEILAKKKKIDHVMICTITRTYCRIWPFIYKKKKESIFGDQKAQIHSFLPFQKEKNPPR
jgi:hypothetical protein